MSALFQNSCLGNYFLTGTRICLAGVRGAGGRPPPPIPCLPVAPGFGFACFAIWGTPLTGRGFQRRKRNDGGFSLVIAACTLTERLLLCA